MRPPGVTADTGPMPDGMRAKFATGFSASEATPLVVDGVMYLATPYTRVVAPDAATGTERWAYTLANKAQPTRSEEHTSELQSLMRISYAVFCLKKKNTTN